MRSFRLSLFRLLMPVAVAMAAMVAPSRGVPLAGEDRPEDGIYDPRKVIPVETRAAVMREIRSIRDSSGLDLLVAVADKPVTWDPQKFADQLSDRWGYHGGRALVLWIPGEAGNPWISIGGMIRSELSGPEIQGMIAKARQMADHDPRPGEAIRKAVVSLGEDLRFAAGRAVRKPPEPRQPVNIRTMDAIFILIRNSKKIIAALAAGAFAFFLIGFWILKAWRRMRLAITPRIFPEVSWRRRFGAPHAGIVYTSSPPRKYHS